MQDSNGGTLYVANTGKAYVLGVKGGQNESGTITFDHYGTATVPAAPTGAVSLSQLQNQAAS